MNGACSATQKIRYATARAAYAALAKAHWARRMQKQPRRAYFCTSCQGYHITSQLNVRDRRERLKREAKRDRLLEEA